MKLKKKIKKSSNYNKLPIWDLKDFYIDINDNQIFKDINDIKNKSKNFQKKYEGNVKNLSSKKLLTAIVQLEKIDEKKAKILSYAYLLYAANIEDKKNKIFLQKIQEKITTLNSLIIFFNLELNLIPINKINKHLNSKILKKYKNWIKISLSYKSHQLEKNLERLIQEKKITSSFAWSRLFDETIANLRFNFEKKELSFTEISKYLTDKNHIKRKNASLVIGEVLKKNINIFTTISNVLAKDKDIDDKWRNFKEPISSRNLSNVVEDRVIDALTFSVKKYYPKISHRYYSLKARWFNKKQIIYWDRNAPLPFQQNKKYSWNDAKSIVLKAYKSFSPEMHAIAEKFFEKKWIDAQIRKGKQGGAFSASTIPSIHPYILINYQGTLRDVSTLAHELGHGIHQYLASFQGYYNASTPLTLAETASVFGEMLTFKYLLNNEENKLRKKILLANKVEDMINTVVRQIAFLEFEKKLHNKRKTSELSTEEICNLWIDVQSDSLGPYVKIKDNYKYYWSYIPHFIHSPFYVYAYAFGDCMVNSLYSVYEKSPKGFEKKYLQLLKSGGSRNYRELLDTFNFNPTKIKFWSNGLDVISKFIDELENI
ncbi:MAG: Oligoendopeptidase F, plasmid [Alphaproteobacteria bacterium MarineAlpha5_Bin12]|nr:MAG: Oligoendopeptidase F, plasmid [Alphaproteobacteria bacterium MarineAlpha5_Bin12]|tara:strand:+ start:15953 stop:17746 length:1794 start_codon:yes stop_codon:yes gene_type:complete